MIAPLVFSLIFFLVSIPVSRARKRNPILWSTASFLAPVTLPFLIQMSENEKIGKELLLRFSLGILATLVGLAIYSMMRSIGLDAYESFILDQVALCLDFVGATYFRNGSIFQLPNMTMEVPSGQSIFYHSVVFGFLSLTFSLFFRVSRPYFAITLITSFLIIGHFLSVGTIFTMLYTFEGPSDVTPASMRAINETSMTIGTILLYSTVLIAAFILRKKTNQKQTEPAIDTSL